MGQDWFTKHTLAEALHVRTEEVQKWIDRGLLRSRIVETGGLQRQIIDAEDFDWKEVIAEAMDGFIAEHPDKAFIVVIPNGSNKVDGGFYVDSEVGGNWDQ